ncbi:hypothetical protein PMZ80_010996 [Knufia obscura]|uniref:AAA+ ATPase domain-containing protein n=1 Tax=Knufia obscura TaxID=1635080 RepID=A0ABR0R7Z2_9EURO|nr:hypothetical protein PMZ80_010996 [Knufia obscura]
MPSSSNATKQTNAVQAGTASTGCLGAPPSSPTTQLSSHAISIAGSPASSRTPIVHQKAPAAAHSDAAGDPLQPLTQHIVTLEHMQQFLELWKTAVGSNVSPGSSSSVTTAPAESPTAPQSVPTKKRASKLTYLSVKEVWNRKDYEYKIVEAPAVEEVNDYDEYLFVVRVRVRVDKSTEKATKYVDIKSTVLRDVLRLVLRNVRTVSLNEDRPSIEQSFLFNFLSEITAYRTLKPDTHPKGDIVLKHLDVLLDYLQAEYKPLQTRLQSLLNNNEIAYDLLWTIFKPNSEIFTTCAGTGVARCVRCNFGEEKKRTNGTKYFHVEGRYLDFDGETFGEATAVLAIEEFRGAKQINLLPTYPLAYHRRSAELKTQLIKRGRAFVSLLGVHHRTYEGKAFYVNKDGHIITTSVKKSRIMVDPSFFRKRNPNYKRANVEPSPDSEASDVFSLSSFLGGINVSGEEEAPLQAVGKDPETLQEQDLLICNPTVYGFSLDLKMWLQFAVTYIRNIVWDESSFDRLAIPAGNKKAVQALCEAHLGRNSDLVFEDFVAGKGQGLITLLHGPPGVGKTLTAETISEHLHRPFYTISAGDLGTNPNDLEQNLSEIFELSSHWKATLLLDEADVFVERRSTSDIHRNALVCIFLRKLEYYDGIMFLTTNRVQTIDEAFASRIHMPLRYNELNESARKKVWTGHLTKAVTKHGGARCSVDDLDRLARKKLNGREITNVTSTALAMAAFDGTVLRVSYLEQAMELSKQFQSDFKGAGYFDSQRSYL